MSTSFLISVKQHASSILAGSWMLGGFFVVATTLGGAGSQYPLFELAIELLALAVLFGFASGFLPSPGDEWGRVAVLILGLILLLPLLQLIPLPADVQHKLPGREGVEQLLRAIGTQHRPTPVSLDPEATWRAFFELLVGAAAFVGTMGLSFERRMGLARLIVGFAVISLVLGAFQAAGIQTFVLFDSTHHGLPTGLFTNRNHQALFLNVAILLAAGLAGPASPGRTKFRPLAFALVLLFAAGVIATRSRAGIVLLSLSLAGAFVVLFAGKGKRTIAYGLAAGITFAAAVWFTSAGQVALDRFHTMNDARFSYWADTRVAISQFWPVGTGFGTFPRVFESFESLGSVGPNFVNHAHNDYLELLLEGGAVAAAAVFIGIAFLLVAGTQRLRVAKSTREVALLRASFVGICIFLVHSIVDYPLRMLSLMAVLGCLAAFLFAPPALASIPNARRERPPLQVVRLLISAAVALALAYEAISVHLADYAVRSGDLQLAQTLSARSADASTWLAQRYLANGEIAAAAAAASNALRSSPIHTRAISILAITQASSGQPIAAGELMDAAAGAGWRDPLTQAWMLDAALKTDAVDVAAQRADAMLRQNLLGARGLAGLRALLHTAEGRRAVMDRLADDPPWRKRFLTEVSHLSDTQLTDEMELLLSMRQAGLAVETSDWSPLLNRLVSRNRINEGRRFWQAMRGIRTEDNVFDRTFDQLAKDWPESGLPFEWTPVPSPEAGMSIELLASTHSRALRVAAEGGAAGPVLQQLLTLTSGEHRLSAELSGEAASAAWFDVQCTSGSRLELKDVAATRSNESEFQFVVPPGCTAQWLRLVLTGSEGAGDLWVDNLVIE